MAKSTRGRSGSVERALAGAAKDLGRFLGTIARKVDSLAGERQQLTTQLRHVQGAAGELLKKLSGEMALPFKKGARAAVAAIPTVSGRKTRRFSAATRKKMAASQRARWAKQKASKSAKDAKNTKKA
jgi:hypothetical protein